MSTPVPSPPSAALPDGPPPSGKKCCQGCVPLILILLAVILAGSLTVLRCGWAVRNVGRVVVEFLEQNSPEEMQAHRRRAMSGEILNNALNRLNLLPNPLDPYEVRDRLLKSLEVEVDGRFLTFTVGEKEKSPAALANAVAGALDEDLQTVRVEYERRFSQNREAQIKSHMDAAERARLEWMDYIKKMDLDPARAAAAEATAAEMRARLSKAQADLILLEARLSVSKDGDEARAALLAERGVLKAAVTDYQKQVQAGTAEAEARLVRQSESVPMRSRYDLELAALQKLREEQIASQIAEGVVKRPTRTVDFSREIQIPDRILIRRLRFAAGVSGVLLAGALLAFLMRRLRRP